MKKLNYNYCESAWHLAYYNYDKTNKVAGTLTNYLFKFKDAFINEEEKYIKAWSEWAKDELLELNIKIDFIVRALGKSETKVSAIVTKKPLVEIKSSKEILEYIKQLEQYESDGKFQISIHQKPLDKLGIYLAKFLNAKYIPEILYKTKITEGVKSLSKGERIKLIKNFYQIADNNYDINNKNMLLIDDVTTTGTTAEELTLKLKNKYSNAKIYFFALCKKSKENEEDNIFPYKYLDKYNIKH